MAQTPSSPLQEAAHSIIPSEESFSSLARSRTSNSRGQSIYDSDLQMVHESSQSSVQTARPQLSGREREHERVSIPIEDQLAETGATSPTQRQGQSSQSRSTQTQTTEAFSEQSSSVRYLKEWIPWMLRKRVAICLALFMWACAAALQGVDMKIRSIQGIKSDGGDAVKALRYVPTVVAILIGFGWKALVDDLKKVTPWATMSNRWEPADRSILLNYVDPLDLKSTYLAARSKHWPLFLVLLGGLLSGALVPLANAISRTAFRLPISRKVTLQQKTTFDLNGSLSMPISYRSTLPEAAYQNVNTAVGYERYLPWTKENYAFESLEIGEQGDDAILRVEVVAFTASLACERLDYSGVLDNDGPNSTITMLAERRSLEQAGCSENVMQMVKQPYNTSTVVSYFTPKPDIPYVDDDTLVPPTAWLNVTRCGQSQDHRILATVMATDLSMTGSTSTRPPSDVKVKVFGLICEPQYYLLPAAIQINATTAKVSDFNVTESKKKPIDVETSALIMQAQLEGIYNPRSREVFEAAATNEWTDSELPNSYDWETFPQLDVMQKWSWLYLYDTSLAGAPVVDPFFSGLIGRWSDLLLNYLDHPEGFHEAISYAFGQKVALIASMFGRKSQGRTFDGTELSREDRIFIQEASLRAIQAILILLGTVALLCTAYRPRTCLIEDPDSIAGISVLLSANQAFELFISTSDLRNDDTNAFKLRNIMCRLQRSSSGLSKLEFREQNRSGGKSRVDRRERPATSHALSQSSTEASFNLQSHPSRTWFRYKRVAESRYRPMSLQTYSRAALLFGVVSMIITFTTLRAVSQVSKGFLAETSALQTAWHYTPTIVLVLVGYGIQSLEGAVATLANYWALASNKVMGENLVLPARIGMRTRLLRPRGLSIAISTGITISIWVYLALKIVAAGLYRNEFSASTSQTVLDIDLTSIFGLEDLADASTQYVTPGMGEYVSSLLQPNFNNPRIQQLVGDLVTPLIADNLTSYLAPDASTDLYSSKITMESFAIQTQVTCIGLDQTEFLLKLDCQLNSSYILKFDCSSEFCHQSLGNLFPQIDTSYKFDQELHGSSEAFYMAALPDADDASLTVLVADFSKLTGHHPEIPGFCLTDGPRTLTLEDLGLSYPSVRGTRCERVMNRVNVTTTMQPAPSEAALSYTDRSEMFWWTTGYDASSLRIFSKVSPKPWPQPLLSNGGFPDFHRGRTLSPVSFYSTVGLIAQAQDVATKNPQDLLEVNNLVKAAQRVYSLESQVALISLQDLYSLSTSPIGLSINLFLSNKSMKSPATVYTERVHIVWDNGTSIAMLSLLAVVLACVVFMCVIIPRKTILPMAPSSIAAQMSLVAGSSLVKRLREEKVVRTRDSKVWGEIFGLGWWFQEEPSPAVTIENVSANPAGSMRWGIDVGILPDKRHVLPHPKPPQARVEPDTSGSRQTTEPENSISHQTPTSGTNTTLAAPAQPPDENPTPTNQSPVSDYVRQSQQHHLSPEDARGSSHQSPPAATGTSTSPSAAHPHSEDDQTRSPEIPITKSEGRSMHSTTADHYYTPLELDDLGDFEIDFVDQID